MEELLSKDIEELGCSLLTIFIRGLAEITTRNPKGQEKYPARRRFCEIYNKAREERRHIRNFSTAARREMIEFIIDLRINTAVIDAVYPPVERIVLAPGERVFITKRKRPLNDGVDYEISKNKRKKV